MEMQNLSGTGEKKGGKARRLCQYPSGRGKVVSFFLEGPEERNPARSGMGDYGFFMQLLKESLEENQKKDLEKYEQLEKKD